MHAIRASVEVRALIGAGHFRQLNENASAHYERWQCGGEGRATEPTSIIVGTGRILVSADMLARRTVPLWVDSAGSPTGFPVNHRRLVLAHETTAAAVATMALGIVLLCLAWAGRWVLDRSRLADWEVAWAAVGPEWTKRFRSPG
jgi:hypothetical protein